MTECALCGRELPPLRWWQGKPLFFMLAPPPLCTGRRSQDCRRRFLARFNVVPDPPTTERHH